MTSVTPIPASIRLLDIQQQQGIPYTADVFA
jgi:hypothetical protein